MTHAATRIRVTGTGPVSAPRRPDGRPFRYELIHDGGGWRAYADTLEPLVAELIDGYWQAPAGERPELRVSYAVRMQVRLQAERNVAYGLDGCTDEQRQVLLADRRTAPVVPLWQAPVPLVLVAAFYQPAGERPRPVAVPPGEIVWLDPATEESLLRSLHRAGAVVLAAHVG